jgi:hypothetical protein
MSKICQSNGYVFQEAIDHCRWKSILRNDVLSTPELKVDNLHRFSKKRFNEIFLDVHAICKDIKGIGMLTVYDITSAICRRNKINIDKIYIIGNGPKTAIRLLGIPSKTEKICKGVTLQYVEIHSVLDAFNEKNYEMSIDVKNSNNGDIFETYICNWQKKYK